MMNNRHTLFLAALLLCAAAPRSAQSSALQEFRLTERLNRSWSNELVSFELNADAAAIPQTRLALKGPDGNPVKFQVVPRDGTNRIFFLADLAPLSADIYRLTDEGAAVAPPTDIRVQEEEEIIRMSNSFTGIECPADLESARGGPILRFRLASGRWIGGGMLVDAPAVTAYRAEIRARGPVFSEIACIYSFHGGGEWNIVFRLHSNEPAVLVSERFKIDKQARWELNISDGFEPTHGIYRTTLATSSAPSFGYVLQPIGAPLRLCAWLPWWEQGVGCYLGFAHVDDKTLFFRDSEKRRLVRMPKPAPGKMPSPRDEATSALLEALKDPDEATVSDSATKDTCPEDDALILAAGRSSLWALPGENGQSKAVPVRSANGKTSLIFQLAGPGREWLLGSCPIEGLMRPENTPSVQQKMYVKHFGTPLQSALEMNLDWNQAGSAENYPRLMFGRDDVERLRADGFESRDGWPDRRTLKNAMLNPEDEKLQTEALAAMTGQVNAAVDWFLAGRNSAENTGPHDYGHLVSCAVAAADLALGSPAADENLRRLVEAQIAFLGFKLASPDLLSEERGFGALPNMIARKEAAAGIVGAFLSSHPMAPQWTARADKVLRAQIESWSGTNGEWLEAIHYQGVSMDVYLWFGLAAARANLSDLLYHPRLKLALLFMAKTLTPPDADYAGRRLLPPTGNTWRGESSAFPGLAARIYAKTDPDLARQLEWAWIQQGCPGTGGVGGDYIMNWHSDIILAREPDLKALDAPGWKSELFPKFGAILRHGFPGPRETYLIYHQGEFHTHYDDDQGSFELWGLGRPLSRDWGYVGCMPARLHNKVETGGFGAVKSFSASAEADYLHGVAPDWERQILLLKDPDGESACIVMNDHLTEKSRTTNWRLWLFTDERPVLEGDTVRMKGNHDVDMDVWLAPPAAAGLTLMTRGELAAESKTDVPPPAPAAPGESSDEGILDLRAGEDEKLPTKFIRTERETMRLFTAMPDGRWIEADMTQHGLRVEVARGSSLLSVLRPRQRDAPPPVITPFAGDRGVRIETAEGTDIVFLSNDEFVYEADGISFEGRAGIVRERAGRTRCVLIEGKKLTFERTE